MKNRLIALVQKTIIAKDKDFRNHLYIFLICVGISLFIWFLIKMSDQYVTEMNMSLEYKNLPTHKLLVKADDRVQVKFRAKGGDIFSVKYLSGRKKLDVDLNKAEIKKSRYFDRYYMISSELEGKITENLSFSHSIVSVTPDTLFFDFEEIASKTVTIVPALTYNFKTQYEAYDSMSISPLDITVSGPASLLDTLTYIKTVPTTFEDLDNNLEAKVSLDLPLNDDRVQYSAREVDVFLPVEKYTESTIDLPITGISGEPGSIIRTFPETVQLTYRVALKDFNSVRPDMFTITATYNPERDNGRNFIRVNLVQSPAFIRVNRIQPDKVEFLIQKQ